MIVRELVTRLGFSVNDGQMKRYESGVNNIKSSAEGAANSFRNMFAAFVGFSALQSLAKTADSMQSLEARIGMLPQTVGEAGDAFDIIARKASDSRSSIEAYGTLYVRLAGATKDYLTTQDDVLQVTDAISNALVVGGANAAEASSAVLQLSQAFQKGKLDGDEFRAFMETMSTDLKTKLAEQLGAKDAGDLFKLSSSGQLTAKKLAFAFKNLAPAINKQMMSIPMTIGQATTIVVNKWDAFINRLNRKSGAVTSVANFMLAGMDKLESGLEKMVEFFGGATNAIKIFGIALMAVFAPSAYAAGVIAFTALFQPLIWSVLGTFLAFVALAVVLEDVYQFFTGGESVLGDFVEWLNSGTIAADAMKHILTGLAIALGAVAVGFTIAWIAALSGPLLIIAGITAVMALLLAFKDKIAEAFGGLKEFFGFGGNVNMSASKVAGAATSAGGTGGGSQTTKNITINQELPPGTAPETAAAARGATEQALSADSGDLSRQMALY
jgi:tape measure domain-containing protein